jgi:hypothetical protein
VPPPVEKIIGLPISAREVEHGREERDAELGGVLLQRDVLLAAELERLAMGAVGRPEAVLVVVRPVEEVARVQRPVVALLELHRVRAGAMRLVEQLQRLVERSLVVVADLGDHVRIGSVVHVDAFDRDRRSPDLVAAHGISSPDQGACE